MSAIVILGAGVMGSAMAVPLAAAGATRIDLVGTHLDETVVRSVQGNGLHPRLNVTMPDGVRAHGWRHFGEVVTPETRLIVLGVSSAGVEWAIDRLCETLVRPVPVLMITKGLTADGERLGLLPDHVRDSVRARRAIDLPVMAVGGPCIAGELAVQRDTSVVLTGPDPEALGEVLGLIGAPFYHARPSADVAGVELCAAFKNFFALGVGWAAGHLERSGKGLNGALMHNLAAGLFTQALRELAILVEAHGGDRASVDGLPGTGDLYVTCLAGRNSRMGRLLGLGLPYSKAKAEHMAADTVEGADLALAVGPTLERQWAEGRLPAGRMPLARAIVAAVTRDQPMTIDWNQFYR
jgi:glycerol-3-phosphate dehydrogenase (NAD(P)+)